MNQRLLIVDDDPEIRGLLAEFLTGHGFEVDTAADGITMDKTLAGSHFDLVILDIMLPGEDGLSLCRRLRAESALPIILLTAISEETDRIIGLEMGADDYLTKPFGPRELLARIRAVLRRSSLRPRQASGTPASGARRIALGVCQLDLDAHRLYAADGREVPITSMEFDLLKAFADHPNQVLSRDQLLDLAHNKDWEPFDRSIDIRIARLRRKIEDDPAKPQVIKTVRGAGYIFVPSAD